MSKNTATAASSKKGISAAKTTTRKAAARRSTKSASRKPTSSVAEPADLESLVAAIEKPMTKKQKLAAIVNGESAPTHELPYTDWFHAVNDRAKRQIGKALTPAEGEAKNREYVQQCRLAMSQGLLAQEIVDAMPEWIRGPFDIMTKGSKGDSGKKRSGKSNAAGRGREGWVEKLKAAGLKLDEIKVRTVTLKTGVIRMYHRHDGHNIASGGFKSLAEAKAFAKSQGLAVVEGGSREKPNRTARPKAAKKAAKASAKATPHVAAKRVRDSRKS